MVVVAERPILVGWQKTSPAQILNGKVEGESIPHVVFTCTVTENEVGEDVAACPESSTAAEVGK